MIQRQVVRRVKHQPGPFGRTDQAAVSIRAPTVTHEPVERFVGHIVHDAAASARHRQHAILGAVRVEDLRLADICARECEGAERVRDDPREAVAVREPDVRRLRPAARDNTDRDARRVDVAAVDG